MKNSKISCLFIDYPYINGFFFYMFSNLQMMLSALTREKRYADLLIKSKLIPAKTTHGASIPSISKLQETIEKAWSLGFDARGREQLGGRVCNTRKWIGATEIVTVLSSLRFQYVCSICRMEFVLRFDLINSAQLLTDVR